jgi:hypothetical protein
MAAERGVKIVEMVNINLDVDPWLSLPALSRYAGLSVRSLRAYLADPHAPLPCYRMKEPHVIPTKTGRPRTVSGKILVRRSDFDAWMQRFKYTPDLDRLVDEVVAEIRR